MTNRDPIYVDRLRELRAAIKATPEEQLNMTEIPRVDEPNFCGCAAHHGMHQMPSGSLLRESYAAQHSFVKPLAEFFGLTTSQVNMLFNGYRVRGVLKRQVLANIDRAIENPALIRAYDA